MRLYVEMADGVDANGHGTHTMGTLAGLPYIRSSTLVSLIRRYASRSHQEIVEEFVL